MEFHFRPDLTYRLQERVIVCLWQRVAQYLTTYVELSEVLLQVVIHAARTLFENLCIALSASRS